MYSFLVSAAGSFSLSPDPSAPGASGLQKVANMGLTYALIICVLGALLSASILALSHGSQMERWNGSAKIGLVTSLAAAAFLGILTQALGAAYTLG